MSFDITTLGEFATVQGGYAYKSQDFKSTGEWSVLKIKNIRTGHVSYNDTSFVSTEVATATNKWATKPGDILISMTGSGPSAPESLVGRVARVWKGEKSALINQRVGRLILKESSKIDLNFLFYLLSLKESQGFLVSNSTGSANQVNISAKTIESVPCPKIDHDASTNIASILLSLDDRITLLRETNTTLEAIAQALFKSWFVDFDPVHANAALLPSPSGRGAGGEGAENDALQNSLPHPNPLPKGEGAFLPSKIAALFPDSFEESELGLVPRGWAVGKVEQLLELAYGKALKALDRIVGTIPVYGSGGITGYHNEALVNVPSIVIGRKGTVGRLYWEDRPFFPIDTVFYVKTKEPLTYCFYQLQRLGLEGMNTDGAVPGLNRNNVYRLLIVLPPHELLLTFDEIISPLRQKIFSNLEQAQTLTTLRDTLLPRLISGQLRLPESEAMFEEVT